MKLLRVLKASDWEVEKISETDWIIKSPDGTYKNSNGKDYHFKTKEDALEELDYLRAEHKFDKKADKRQLDYNKAFDAIQTAIDNDLITDPDTQFDDVSYELIEQANLDPDSLTDEEYNYWKEVFLEAWQNVDWNY